MMQSLIGGLLIFAACSAVGFSAARMYRTRVDQLDAFLRLISHIRAQIEYCRIPLDRIFDEYSCEILAGCGFLPAARELGASGGFECCLERLLLEESQVNSLAKFFAGLGRHNAAEESSFCALCEREISESLARERSELAKRTKLCRTFGVLTGFLLAVLLI